MKQIQKHFLEISENEESDSFEKMKRFSKEIFQCLERFGLRCWGKKRETWDGILSLIKFFWNGSCYWDYPDCDERIKWEKNIDWIVLYNSEFFDWDFTGRTEDHNVRGIEFEKKDWKNHLNFLKVLDYKISVSNDKLLILLSIFLVQAKKLLDVLKEEKMPVFAEKHEICYWDQKTIAPHFGFFGLI